MDVIRIILVDDHQIVRDGIKSILQKEADIDVIAEVGDSNELSEVMKFSVPDIILMDISLQNESGIEITKKICRDFPEIKIIILSMYISEEFVINAIQSGAVGYLVKNSTKTELFKAIRTVFEGGEYFPPNVSRLILKKMVKSVRQESTEQLKKEELTKREIEILKLYADGFSNKEIADRLIISSRTVESHKNHIMQKLGLKSPVDMIKYALKIGISEV